MRITSAQRRAGVAFAVAALLATASPAGAQQRAMTAGEGDIVICAGQDGKSALLWQADGNLVDYDEVGHARWASNTEGRGVEFFRYNGNYVVADNGGYPRWASNTAGHPHDWLVCQEDGNVVIYDPGPVALWATGTQH